MLVLFGLVLNIFLIVNRRIFFRTFGLEGRNRVLLNFNIDLRFLVNRIYNFVWWLSFDDFVFRLLFVNGDR